MTQSRSEKPLQPPQRSSGTAQAPNTPPRSDVRVKRMPSDAALMPAKKARLDWDVAESFPEAGEGYVPDWYGTSVHKLLEIAFPGGTDALDKHDLAMHAQGTVCVVTGDNETRDDNIVLPELETLLEVAEEHEVPELPSDDDKVLGDDDEVLGEDDELPGADELDRALDGVRFDPNLLLY
jgi:hypothetical protein